MQDMAHRARVCPRIAYMPQGLGRNLYPDLSIRENIEFFSRLFDQSRTERLGRIADLLQSTSLALFADRPAKKLSGGMRQKLGLCCSLILPFRRFHRRRSGQFQIERGEIFGFVGSNGCGKTTTMKMLTGLLPASEGQAMLFGRRVDAHDIGARNRVGYMSQSFRSIPS
jgi:ABC-type multidrug transport system ATPase subunit